MTLHRRRLLQLAAGVTAGLAGGAEVSGCASRLSAVQAAAGLPGPSATLARAGSAGLEVLRWGLPYGEPDTVDPPNTAAFSSALIAANLCDPLLRLNPDYSVSPNLADYRQSDAQTIVFTLRSGVRFWNGDALTMQDVVWSLKHGFSPETVVGSAFSMVQSVKQTGPMEVTVSLQYPDSMFVQGMANLPGMIQQASYATKAGDALGSAQAGIMATGPFKLERWTPGGGIELAANPYYWNEAARPHAKTVQLLFTTDSGSLAQALVSGQIDGAYEVPAAVIPKLEGSGAGRLAIGEPSQLYLQLFAVQPDGVYSDPKVRQALCMTLDRKALAEVVYYGAADPNYTFINTGTWQTSSTPPAVRALWQAAYEPFEKVRSTWGSTAAIEQAKTLLKQTSYSGEQLVLGTLAGDATISLLAQLVQAQAALAGMDIRIEQLQPIEYETAQVEASARTGIDMMLSVGYNGTSNPAEPLLYGYLPGSPYNYTGFADKTVIGLIEDGMAELDPVAEAKLLIQAQSAIEQRYDSVTLLQIKEICYLRDGLAGAVTSFSYFAAPSLAYIGPSA